MYIASAAPGQRLKTTLPSRRWLSVVVESVLTPRCKLLRGLQHRTGNTKATILVSFLFQSEPAPPMPHVDGRCTDRILFSIPVPSQVEFFSLPFLSPDLSFFFLQLYFLPAPYPDSFFFFAFETFLTHLLPPIVSHRPTHLYI
jgi:hypothetical protein